LKIKAIPKNICCKTIFKNFLGNFLVNFGQFWSLFCAITNLPELLNVKGTKKIVKNFTFSKILEFGGFLDKEVLFLWKL
jgi:hypothetical protein